MLTTWMNMNTDERCKAIAEVYAPEANTVTSIAAALSEKLRSEISRNAIAGMYGRHRDLLKDCPLSGKGGGAYAKSARSVAAPVARASRVKKVDPVKVATVTKIFERAQAAPVPAPLNFTLLELNHGDCRWPVSGDGAKTLFCGHNVEVGKSYCECHARMSVGRGTESERRATSIGKAA